MGLKDKSEKAKAERAAGAETKATGPGLTPEEREAMLGADAPENWTSTGNKYLYKAEHFAASKDGDLIKCYREGANGQKHYTAPWLYGIPFAITSAPSDYKEGEIYERIVLQTTRATFVYQGEGDQRVAVKVNPGELVMIDRKPGTERIAQLAELQDKAVEVMCRPTHKGPIKGNKTMWFWDIKENPVAMKRQLGPAPVESLEGNPLA